MSTKPTILLVPGGWHEPESFAAFTAQMESAGYTVRGVSLASVGAEEPLKDIQPDVDVIRSTIKSAADADEDVFVLMHSYGGVPGGEAVKGLDKMSRRKDGKTGGVSHMFYCAAFALGKGKSLYDGLGGKPLPWFDISEDEMIVKCASPKEIFYHDLDEETIERESKALKPHSHKTFYSKTTWEPYREIPSTYLYCEQDKAIPIEVQHAMVENMKGVKWNTETMDTSHSPFLKDPEKLARIVRKTAGETI